MSDSENLDDVLKDDPKPEDSPEPEAKPQGDAADESEPKGDDKAKDDEPMMPVAAHVAERKELQKRLEFAEEVARRSTTPAAETPSAVDPVDFLAEPEKIAGFIGQKIKQATEGLSKSYAARQHGMKAVNEAHTALQAHGTPAEQQALAASDDPWGDVVDWHQKREALAEIGGDPVAWRKAETARIEKDLLAKAAVAQAKGTLDPAPSLAGETNLGTRADKTETPDDSLEALLK